MGTHATPPPGHSAPPPAAGLAAAAAGAADAAGAPKARSALLVTWELLEAPSAAGIAVLRRLQQGGVIIACVHDERELSAYGARHGLGLVALAGSAPLTPRLLLQALRTLQADGPASWLVTHLQRDIAPAGSAGLGGVVLVAMGDAHTADAAQEVANQEHGIYVRSARSLSDVPRVLSPRGGGCWHQP